MRMVPAITDERTTLEREFPHWHVWAARRDDGTPGDLMATRRRDLSMDELRLGLAQTLPMGYGANLREQLAKQAERERALP